MRRTGATGEPGVEPGWSASGRRNGARQYGDAGDAGHLEDAGGSRVAGEEGTEDSVRWGGVGCGSGERVGGAWE